MGGRSAYETLWKAGLAGKEADIRDPDGKLLITNHPDSEELNNSYPSLILAKKWIAVGSILGFSRAIQLDSADWTSAFAQAFDSLYDGGHYIGVICGKEADLKILATLSKLPEMRILRGFILLEGNLLDHHPEPGLHGGYRIPLRAITLKSIQARKREFLSIHIPEEKELETFRKSQKSDSLVRKDVRTQAAILEVLNGASNDLQRQYKEFLKVHPGATGRYSFRMKILPDGTVKDVIIEEDAFRDSTFSDSLVKIISSLQFRSIKEDRIDRVRVPFTFSP